jgi:branched-chain amino acid transport system permease protein
VSRPRGRPGLVTSYRQDEAPLGTTAKRAWLAVLVMLLLVLPLQLDAELNALMATAFLSAIGAIGLNVVTGWAGQVSLGHAFFLGVGAYTGAVLAGDPDSELVGLGLDMVLWLPAAGLVAAVLGLLVAPVATRLRGLYLAIVTLGLVFLGAHVFNEADSLTGGAGIGREAPDLVLAGVDLESTSSFLGLVTLDREMKLYFLSLALLVIFALLAKNLTRSAIGRAFAAVRDRDLAAELMGVQLTRYKVIAFGVSSFYGGVAGAMLTTVTGFVEPGTYDLFLSVDFVAMVLIGGAGTLAGALMGAAFVTLLPRLVEEVPSVLPFITSESTGGVLTTFQLQTIIYGSLIVAFLIAEPRGLFGLWVRARSYFKAWPFSY